MSGPEISGPGISGSGISGPGNSRPGYFRPGYSRPGYSRPGYSRPPKKHSDGTKYVKNSEYLREWELFASSSLPTSVVCLATPYEPVATPSNGLSLKSYTPEVGETSSTSRIGSIWAEKIMFSLEPGVRGGFDFRSMRRPSVRRPSDCPKFFRPNQVQKNHHIHVVYFFSATLRK